MMKRTLILIGLAVVVVAGCKPKAAVTEITAEERQAMDEVLASCRFDKEVCKYLANGVVGLDRAQTVVVTSDGGEMFGGEVVNMMDGQGNMQMTMKKAGKELSNMIVIDKVSYVKDVSDGKWWKYEGKGTSQTNQGFDYEAEAMEMNEKFRPESSELVVTNLGEEACGEFECFKYEMYLETNPGEKTVVWFDRREYLIRKMETMIGGVKTTMMYEYGPVTISVPSPVKEIPAVPKMNQGEMPSQADLERLMENLPQGGFGEEEIPGE